MELIDQNGRAIGPNPLEPSGSYVFSRKEDDVTAITLKVTATSADPYGSEDPNLGIAQQTLNLDRVEKVSLEALAPKPIVAGGKVLVRVRISCPAPAGGVKVSLSSSDQNAVEPQVREILIGQGDVDEKVLFSINSNAEGQYSLFGNANVHDQGQLDLTVEKPKTALVLSGGGSKGAFQVGALLFLAEQGDLWNVEALCGTSVGSVNAVGVYEGFSQQTLDALLTAWLETPSFYEQEQWLKDIDLPDTALDSLLGEGGEDGNFESRLTLLKTADGINDSIKNATKIAAIAGLVPWTALLKKDPLDKVLDPFKGKAFKVLAGFLTEKSLYHLEPLRAALEDGMSNDVFSENGARRPQNVSLRLTLVDLEDGQLYYANERAQIIEARPIASRRVFVRPNGTSVKAQLKSAVLGSSAVPAILATEPVEGRPLSGYGRRFFDMADGGLRDVVLEPAALDLAVNRLITISASPPEVDSSDASKLTVLARILRSTQILGNEISKDDTLALDASLRPDLSRELIAPEVNVHGAFERDPGLLRINMAYGYMMAYDSRLEGGLRAEARKLTTTIIETRMNAWTFEKLNARQPPGFGNFSYEQVLWRREDLFTLRTFKNQIYKAISDRFNLLDGAQSVPPFPQSIGSQESKDLGPNWGAERISDWFDNWEAHDGDVDNPNPKNAAFRLRGLPGASVTPPKPFEPQQLSNGSPETVVSQLADRPPISASLQQFLAGP